jgi:hypothetical protein
MYGVVPSLPQGMVDVLSYGLTALQRCWRKQFLGPVFPSVDLSHPILVKLDRLDKLG